MFFAENVSFIYSTITLFWNISYYFSGLEHWNWRPCSQKKKHVFSNFVEKYVRLKAKKYKINFIITIIIEYAWICLRSWICQNSEYGKVLNMTGFSICERYTGFWICPNMPWKSSEYILGSKYARILNIKEFWICKSHIGL